MERSSEATDTRWEGLPAVDREGAHLGTCVRTFHDSGVGTTVTEWVVVDVEGRGPSVLPGRDAREVDGRLQLDVVRAVVLEAPTIGDVIDLTDEAVAALAYHYALSDDAQPDTTGAAHPRAEAPASGATPSAPAPVAAAASALPPLAGVAGLTAAVAVVLGMRERRARQRRRPTQRAARAASALQRRTTSVAGRSSARLAGAGTALSPALRSAAGTTRRTTSAVSGTARSAGQHGRRATGSVAAVPRAVAHKGRRAKRSASRTLWKLEVLSAAAAGYVAGARAGRERYKQIVQGAGRLSGRLDETRSPDQRT